MINRIALLFTVIIVLSFPSCDKEDFRISDYLMKFATVIKTKSSVTFQLDNGVILTSQNTPTITLENKNRVILNYTPLENGLIKINNIRPIFVGTIEKEGYPDKINTHPIKIESIWVSGKYLNMSFKVDYHSMPHTPRLFKDPDAEQTTLYFSYTRGEDPSGAPTLIYLSFDLEGLEENEFTILIHTDEGVRKFMF